MRNIALPEFVSATASLLYPATCVACSANVERAEYLCGDCKQRAPRIAAPFCAKCSEPFPGAITQTFSCANCEHRVLHFDCAVAAYRSRGLVRRLVHQFKYARQRHLRHPVAFWLRETLNDSRLRDRRFDLIVPVPLHPARERERGFNQAELLADLVAAWTNLPTRNVLERIRYTTTQTAYDRAERMENLHGAFRLRKNRDVRGLHVLLIDDVLTTGSTLSECARVLRKAGAVSVHAATAARA
ncbi:MAG TPA: ComF family protein [Chthoniobacterales bacterium]|jgi:ComF family protein|nr:ComF family protein [Chthoniobacterales bacterium]